MIVMPERVKGTRVENITWLEVEKRVSSNAIGILPIGTASKEHGFHLPMNTDYLQAEWLVNQLIQKLNVLVWPTLGYGYYPAFIDYPGSVSLTAELFSSMVKEILINIEFAGISRIAVLNTGISTIKPLENLVREFEGADLKLINVYHGKRCKSITKEIQEQPFGSHGDEIETSILLVIAPNTVSMSQATSCTTREFVKGSFNRHDPLKENYSPSGVYGNSKLASKVKGDKILGAMLQDILEQLIEW